MRTKIQDIYNKLCGNTVFIVGGGNSLHNFDFSLLNGKNVIAINSAYKYVHDSSILFWCDGSWIAKNDRDIRNHPSPYKLMPINNADIPIQKNMPGPVNSIYLKRTGDFGYDSHYDNVKGNNSGAMAINFAINMGASRIVLLGFDLGNVMKKSHFHNDYEQPVSQNVYNDMFIPSFKALAESITHLPVEIINCSDYTNLNVFKKGNVRDYL